MAKSQTIYLLHGWALHDEQQKNWSPLMAELQQVGVTAQLLSIPGLSAPLKASWSLDDYARWLAANLPAQPVILLGHSFGGQLAIRFTSSYPKRVQKLILIDSAGLRDWSWQAKLKRRCFAGLAKFGKKFTKSNFLRNLLYRLARERDYFQAPPSLRQTLSNVLADEVWQDLHKIKQPTQIIWGEDDRVTPLKMAYALSEKISGNQLYIVRGARHAPQFSHPHQVAEQVCKFIDRPS